MIALQLGRPSGIADKDIDIEFPLNIDLDVTDPKHIFEMQNRQIDITRDKTPGEEYTRGYEQVNSMTSSIHNVRLNQLKQVIQDTIYRLDKPLRDPGKGKDRGLSGAQPIDEVESVLKKLGEWRACRPIQPPGSPTLPLLSKEQLEMDYHEVRTLSIQMIRRLTASTVRPDVTASHHRESKDRDVLCPALRRVGSLLLRGEFPCGSIISCLTC